MNQRVPTPVIYAASLVLAACSLLYELLIAQTLATLAANTVVWYSVTIGVYLAAMGLGALLHDRYSTGNLWARLFRVELLLCAVGVVAVPVLHFTHTFAALFDLNDLTLASNAVFFGSAFILIAIIGMLTGFELPLLIDLGNAASPERSVTNRVLASDYMGSLVGGFAFPLLLVPNLSLIMIGLITASINLIMALLALVWLLPKSRRPVFRLAVCGTLSGAILVAMVFAQPIEQYFVKKYYYYFDYSDDWPTLFGNLDEVRDVFRARSPYQRIDLVYDGVGYDTDVVIDAYSTKFTDNPEQPMYYVLFLNGDFQLVSSYEEYYHEWFAHVPIAKSGAIPKRVLVMGAGDGLLIRELVKYPDIETIVHVDLDHKLVDLARTHPVLLTMNEGALDDPRVQTYFDDAYRWIRNTTETFDAIYLDFPFVQDYNLSKLYSREFFHFVRQRLAPFGFVVLDTPGLERLTNRRVIYETTIRAAGFDRVMPYISTIESRNEDAVALLRRKGYNYAEIKFLLADHARSLQYGFLMASNEQRRTPPRLDPDVRMHVLNEERLGLTLGRSIPSLRTLDPDKVNSIFRPTLPDGEVWDIRTAW